MVNNKNKDDDEHFLVTCNKEHYDMLDANPNNVSWGVVIFFIIVLIFGLSAIGYCMYNRCWKKKPAAVSATDPVVTPPATAAHTGHSVAGHSVAAHAAPVVPPRPSLKTENPVHIYIHMVNLFVFNPLIFFLNNVYIIMFINKIIYLKI